MLNSPYDIFVAINLDLYVADTSSLLIAKEIVSLDQGPMVFGV